MTKLEMSIAGMVESTTDINIYDVQQAETAPSDLILPPQAQGTYSVDESVISCKIGDIVVYIISLLLLDFSLPYCRNKASPCV